jgi:hypothetical protein
MPANIFGMDQGNDVAMAAFRGQPAWWGGKVLPNGFESLKHAREEAGLTYSLRLEPHVITLNNVQVNVGQYSIVRGPCRAEPVEYVLGTVADNYELISLEDLDVVLQPLFESRKLDTVGALGHGERVFFTFEGEAFDINGDEHRSWIMAAEDHTGGGAFTIAEVTTRVVCGNTYAVAMASAKNVDKFVHNNGVKGLLKFRAMFEKSLIDQRKSTREQFAAMMTYQMTTTQINTMLEKAFPTKGKPTSTITVDREGEFGLDLGDDPETVATREKGEHDRQRWVADTARQVERRKDAAVLINKFGADSSDLRNTAYAAINGLNQYADWGFKDDGKGTHPMQAILFGLARTGQAACLSVCCPRKWALRWQSQSPLRIWPTIWKSIIKSMK